MGNDREEHVAVLLQIAGLAVEHRHAAADLVEDHIADLEVVFADDLDLRSPHADRGNFADDHRSDERDHHAVKNVCDRHVRPRRKLQQDDKPVDTPQRNGNGRSEIFMQNERRNVGAARRSAHAHDNADPQTEEDPAEDTGEHGIVQRFPERYALVRVRINAVEKIENAHKRGIQQSPRQRCRGEFLSQHDRSHDKQRNIRRIDRDVDDPIRQVGAYGRIVVEQIPDENAEARRPPHDKSERYDKKSGRRSCERIAEQDDRTVQRKLFELPFRRLFERKMQVLHDCSCPLLRRYYIIPQWDLQQISREFFLKKTEKSGAANLRRRKKISPQKQLQQFVRLKG